MAAQTSNAPSQVRKGVNEDNHMRFYASFTGAWADADTMEVTLPTSEGYEVGGWSISGHSTWTDGAGAAGARVRTFRTPAQVPLTSFDEATGKVVFTNSSGGPITDPKFMFNLTAST